MKKTIMLAAILATSSFAAFAQQGGFSDPKATTTPALKGGFEGPKVGVTTVAAAKQMQDDTKVTLRGKIIQSVGHEKYIFKDSTDQIVIEIDDEDWRGVTVTPQDQVEIYGEVDKDWNSVEIEVDSIRKVS